MRTSPPVGYVIGILMDTIRSLKLFASFLLLGWARQSAAVEGETRRDEAIPRRGESAAIARRDRFVEAIETTERNLPSSISYLGGSSADDRGGAGSEVEERHDCARVNVVAILKQRRCPCVSSEQACYSRI